MRDVLRIGVIMYQTSLSKGQELVAQRMVKEFRSQNCDAFLITSPFHDGEPVVSEEEITAHGGYLYQFDERMGIPVIRVGSMNTSWPPRRISLSDFVGVLSKIVDDQKLNVLIVHSTLWNGPEDVLKFIEWRRNLSKTGFPHLTPIFCHMSHFQEASPERYEMVERTFREAWNNTSLAQIVKAADLVLVVSPYEKQVMKELGADESKFFLFPGGIEDLDGERGEVEKLRAKYGIPDGVKVVGSLGTVEERKNTMAVVEVARMLETRRDVHFVIAGLEPGEYARKVRAAAEQLPNVSMLGPISDDEKSALIKASTVNIIMSRSEALGIAQLEFMASGVPVVSSGSGGQQWVVRNGESGFIIDGPEDVTGAARAVAKIAENESLRTRLGANARRRASAYSMSRLVSDLVRRLGNIWQDRSDEDRLRRGLPEDEQVLEAMVSGGTRVIVTNRRLFVKHDNTDHEPTSIKLKEIEGLSKTIRYPWAILGAGAAASAALFFLAFGSPLSVAMHWLLGWTPISPVAGFIPGAMVAIATLFLFAARRRPGYLLKGGLIRVFIPAEFIRLLHLADRLTPVDLFNSS